MQNTGKQSALLIDNSTIDAEEVAGFARIADEWWDENGKFKPLHRLNPLRISTICQHICSHFQRPIGGPDALAGLKIIDIGCGGGLISEPLAKLGGDVTGLDAAAENIAVAKLHAQQTATTVNYRTGAAEQLANESAQFDVVLALEIIEHVANVEAFYDAICALLRPGGLLIMSTLNRTAKSYAMAILGAEYILRWVPRGTHTWSKFVRPSEMQAALNARQLQVKTVQGLVFNPRAWQFAISDSDLDVNYLLTASNF
jgi:2-polyprenyl-6-hydroxyphenyl methylase/3-demethylubiquinone-9 3-methyltransferase